MNLKNYKIEVISMSEEFTYEEPTSVRMLLFVAAMAALGFVLGSIAIPVCPNVHVQFGAVPMLITAVVAGPIYGFIVGFIMIMYTGLVIWGEVTVPFGFGFQGAAMAYLNKKLPFPIAGFLTWALVGLPYWVITEYFISGYPWELIFVIQIKSLFNDAILAPIVAYGLLKITGIGKYIPVSWDTLASRKLLKEGNL